MVVVKRDSLIRPDWRLTLQPIEGILFDTESYERVSDLIELLKLHRDFEICPHPRMSHGRGELWLAHRGPDAKHKRARGVFARFIPSEAGVKFTHRKNGAPGFRRTKITPANTDEVLKSMVCRYEETKERVKVSEKAEPNKPGTVSGGQFESNRRKH
jgi:hypothetical protein